MFQSGCNALKGKNTKCKKITISFSTRQKLAFFIRCTNDDIIVLFVKYKAMSLLCRSRLELYMSLADETGGISLLILTLLGFIRPRTLHSSCEEIFLV